MGVSMKPGVAAGIPSVPFISLGEVKNVRSYRAALRQLASRAARGNTALAVYDDGGNVWLQVFGKTTSPATPAQLIYDQRIGRVAPPRDATGTPIKPGTAPFGNAIEPKIMDLISMATGQRFRAKRANAGGPDLIARELHASANEVQGEVLSPAVTKIVQTARALLRDWNAAGRSGVRNAQARRAKTLNELAARALRLMRGGGLTRYEIDILSGLFYGLERTAGGTGVPNALREFRQAAREHLGLSTV